MILKIAWCRVSKAKGPLTWPIALRVPLAVAEHVQAAAKSEGLTVHAYLTKLLQSKCSDWPWHIVRMPDLCDSDPESDAVN